MSETVGHGYGRRIDVRQRGYVTYRVYSARDAAAILDLKMSGSGRASVTVNGLAVMDARRGAATAAVSLSGGVNKVTVTGESGTSFIDRLGVRQAADTLPATVYEAEAAQLAPRRPSPECSFARSTPR